LCGLECGVECRGRGDRYSWWLGSEGEWIGYRISCSKADEPPKLGLRRNFLLGYEEWWIQNIRVLLTTFSTSGAGAGGNPLRDGGLEAAKARLGKARILKRG